MQLNKIVIATDFSHGAEIAFGRGLALASKSEAEVVLVHVVGAGPSFPIDAMEVGRAELTRIQGLRREMGNQRLEALVKLMRGRGIEASSKLLVGAAAHSVAEVAADADLVITGARGTGDNNVFIIGSVAEGVARRSQTNVLVARGAEDPASGFKKILVATDLTEASRAVVHMAMNLAATNDAEIEILHVVDSELSPVSGAYSPSPEFKELWKAVIGEADQELDALIKRAGRADVKVSHSVVEGIAAPTVLARLKDGGYDLLVVGKHRTQPALYASVSERLVRHASCSVLVAKRASVG